MKILKIAFQNINSLRGEHTIDFTKAPFLQNSLFAITGPTGSGKTTILDVISLALFNQVPRLGKMSTGEILKKGALLTRNQTEAYARITYRCKEGIFTSTWSISTNRNGKLRDYHMEITDAQSETIIDLKKSDVPGKNEELIGLNYDQFIKSVVLAQGEFAKFLQVPKKERGALLEKITGTEIYRRIGMEVYLKHKERAKELDLKRAKIETYKEQLLDESEFINKQHEAKKLAGEKELLLQTLESRAKEIELKNKLQKEEKELEKSLQELDKISTLKNVFDSEKGEKLKRHQDIQLFEEDLNLWQNLEEKITGKSKEISAITDALTTANTNREGLKQEFAELYKLHIDPANFSNQLESYKSKVRSLITDRNEIATTYKNSKTHIERLAAPLQFTTSVTQLFDFENELLNKQRAKTSAYKKLEAQFDLKNTSIDMRQKETQELLRQLRNAERAHTQLTHLKNKLDDEIKDLEQLKSQKAGLPNKIEKLNAQLELKEAQLEVKRHKLEIEQLQKQLEDFRSELQPEVPCPLCGSLDHPFATQLPQQENGLKIAVSQLEHELNTLIKTRTIKETSLKNLTGQSQELQERIQRLSKELKTAQNLFDTENNTVISGKENFSFRELENQLGNKERELKIAKQLQEELVVLQSLQSQTQHLKELIEAGTTKSEAIAALFTGKNFEQEISLSETNWNRNEQHITQQTQLLKTAKENLNTLTKQNESLAASLLKKLQEKGYTTIEKALESRLNASVAQSWTQENQKLDTELIRLKTLSAKLIEEIKILQQTAGSKPLNELLEEQSMQKENLDSLETAAASLSRLILNQEQYLGWISDLKIQIETELKDAEHWHILNDLIGDATGNKFNDFAQDLTLAQLLQLANKRLLQLTDRYRIDQPGDEEDDSLVAIDEHMGGQRRSIKTLSGGETFILSLALALALSDLASRNIEINSLFIDEGFGTLDPETLDQTLDTLEVLQAESSKMIGVISHVDSLKERIATQIQLTQNGQGYSTLRVI